MRRRAAGVPSAFPRRLELALLVEFRDTWPNGQDGLAHVGREFVSGACPAEFKGTKDSPAEPARTSPSFDALGGVA
jgi:hypothetical protein